MPLPMGMAEVISNRAEPQKQKGSKTKGSYRRRRRPPRCDNCKQEKMGGY